MKNTNEIWVDIYGYEGIYQVSNYGNVKSLERKIKNGENSYMIFKERFVKPYDRGEYLCVALWKNRKRKVIDVHRLVAQHFVSNDNLFRDTVDHINMNKHDNRATNLRWATQKEQHNFKDQDVTERSVKNHKKKWLIKQSQFQN